MQTLDWIVVVLYFTGMTVIGAICMRRIKHQEDFFLGGRSFGKIMQAFAAFGAGTGANDPVTLGRTVYGSGLSGIWSVLLWLFVTPFYWIFGVWYRRMRHITLGDWFAERYQCGGLGALYAVFGLCFYMFYLSVAFSAVAKVCRPLLRTGLEAPTFNLPVFGTVEIQYVLVPIIATVVIVYGVLGGLRAAYWTDLIQGIFIVLLSVLLIPFGLWELVKKFGEPAYMGVGEGFRIMHEQVPAEYFDIIGSSGSEFPLYYIVAISLLNLIGIVVQPHFIATGGGSAKTETSARVGLVCGNFLKRLCTVGWALTALIVLALLAGDVDIAYDPDSVWGIASKRILGPLNLGLVGLMLACLLAALMSSADCYMLVSSALFVRNLYAPLRPDASERHYVFVGRLVSFVMITGAAGISLYFMDVFGQLKIAWEIPMIFAAVFWVGMFWRRATRAAAWLTALFAATVFFILPICLPLVWKDLRENQRFAHTNLIRTETRTRSAAPADVARREAEMASWEKRRQEILDRNPPEDAAKALANLGEKPEILRLGDPIQEIKRTGGKPIYWTEGVEPVGEKKLVEVSREPAGENTVIVTERYDCELRGIGVFNLHFLLYDLVGLDLESYPDPVLETLRFPPKILAPFILMILLSLLTRRAEAEGLDRFYVKMKTPVDPDPEEDRRELELSYADPGRFDHKRLFSRRTQLEFQRPTALDIIGFVLSFAAAFGIIWLAVWLANIGA